VVGGASVASAGKASGLAAARRGHGRAALQARQTAWWAGAGAAGAWGGAAGRGRRCGGAARRERRCGGRRDRPGARVGRRNERGLRVGRRDGPGAARRGEWQRGGACGCEKMQRTSGGASDGERRNRTEKKEPAIFKYLIFGGQDVGRRNSLLIFGGLFVAAENNNDRRK
jgi:hypothetical protein